MFLSFFSSKSQKLVTKWTKEHKEIIVLAHKVIAEYSLNNYAVAKKHLVQLNKVTINHLMIEDIELYKLLKEDKTTDEKVKKLIIEFKESFRTIKISLMKVLTKYSQPKIVLDEIFFKTFSELVDILLVRIEFEEKNLYITLNK